MNCPECQDLIQRRLDGDDVPAGPPLDDHLASCPPCREQHAAAARLLDALKARPRITPPADLAQRLVTAVLRDRELRRRRMRLRLLYTAGLAASILGLLIAGYFWAPTRDPAPPPVIADHSPKKPAPEPPPEPPTPKEPERAVASLSERLADTMREQALILRAATGPLEDVPFEMEPLDPAAVSLRQAGQEVSAGVQTVTRASRRALDYFVRELPTLDVPSPN
jgi:hypothetical protein